MKGGGRSKPLQSVPKPKAKPLPRSPMYEEGSRVPTPTPEDWTDTGVEEWWGERDRHRRVLENARVRKGNI